LDFETENDMRVFVDPHNGQPVTPAAQVWNNIDADVEESVVSTPQELLARYAQHRTRVTSRLGYGVNSGRWQIDGVWPNNNSDKKNGSLNRKLGEEILGEHGDKTINVLRDFERKCVQQSPK
jgi:hypothetical protein